MIPCPRKIAGAMPRWKRRNSDTAALNTSPSCSIAIHRRFVRAARTSTNCRTMRRRDGFEKKGGRKKASTAMPALEDNFIEVVSDHTAGDPQREEVVWTYLSSTEIAQRLERLGTPV